MLLPIVGVRVGRYVFVLGDLEDMDITHFLHVVGSDSVRLVSLLRARFDECQSVAGIGAAMGDRCPKSEHAKRQESVDLRHPQCSLKSVESAGHRKVRSIIEERGKSEESRQPMLHSSCSAIELYGAALGLAVRQRHTHIALSKQSERDQSTS